MPVDNAVIVEAERLKKKFGDMAQDVAKEIKYYDQNDAYFWDCVVDYLNTISA